MKTISCWLLMITLAVIGALAGCGGKPVAEKPSTPVRVQPVQTYSTSGTVRYSAAIKPEEPVQLAFKNSGYIVAIHQVRGVDGRLRNVQAGDWVAAGTVLARVREDDYTAKVQQAQAQVAEVRSAISAVEFQLVGAKATQAKAALDYERAANLFQTQSLTKADYDRARQQLDTSQSQVDALQAQLEANRAKLDLAKAQLESAQIALADCALKAPRRGQVLQRDVEIGDLAGPGTLGFVLADTTRVRAAFGVPDRTLPKVKLGNELVIITDALPGREFTGRITRIDPAADPTTMVFEVELTLPNPRHELKVGMVASLALVEETVTEPVPVVPLNAIVRPKGNPDGFAVFVVEDQAGRSVVRSRTITLGDAFGNLIAVKGINPGERIVVTGASMLADGETVRVLP
ncbi:MAG TPA: efflux RND transporter periplasmic adaptor subunit [Acidobacteriota bacterium]|nr:efflux RND transporter periplasmic adaptor subunit [Acidobacteriota bacterium]